MHIDGSAISEASWRSLAGYPHANPGGSSSFNRLVGLRSGSALLCRRSLLGLHAERDAFAFRLLTRRALCSLESFRNLCGRLFASHALEKAHIVF